MWKLKIHTQFWAYVNLVFTFRVLDRMIKIIEKSPKMGPKYATEVLEHVFAIVSTLLLCWTGYKIYGYFSVDWGVAVPASQTAPPTNIEPFYINLDPLQNINIQQPPVETQVETQAEKDAADGWHQFWNNLIVWTTLVTVTLLFDLID